MSEPQRPIYRIFKTIELAEEHVARCNYLCEERRIKFVAMCVRPNAYLVAHEGFNPIKLGFDYPTFPAPVF